MSERMHERWPWVVGIVAALFAGFGIGVAVQPEPEPEIINETVTETETVVEYDTPQECEMALDAAFELIDAFRDLWSVTSPVLDEPYDAQNNERLNDELDRFSESLDVLTPRWHDYASQCDPRYDY
ncbi:hypothetical protein [Phytoactinopolyspora halotolerans]|uniref:Uncharacterized protein n=1 Tax=Phytoactinopolyspora halotolerans TaxID=1981512 RepID=A0A6L9S1A3_9ACTN|nr:hypothetical protein [Phytoactinopolyspora halotolerans]NED98600.1 hypothetical protein [Phytoactinopolyspora halotolerans]